MLRISKQIFQSATIAAGLVLAVMIPDAAFGEGWSANLRGGGQVQVDPQTNRTTIDWNGVKTQMWDGVHQLEDGSTITVKSGQVIPNREILHNRGTLSQPKVSDRPTADMWIGAPIAGASPCESLLNRVCGESRACGDEDGCSIVQQLLGMEQKERAGSNNPNRMTYSSGQCQEADRDRKFFSSCSR